MIEALVIPADEAKPVHVVQVAPKDLDAYQALVGGKIEPLILNHPDATLWLNEDGKDALPRNNRATLLGTVQNVDWRYGDYICGDAFVVGPDRRGVDTTLPPHYKRMLTATHLVVRSRIGNSSWLEHAEVHTDMWAAYRAALDGVRAIVETELMVIPRQYQE